MHNRAVFVTAEGETMNSNVDISDGHHQLEKSGTRKKRAKPAYQHEPNELRDQIWNSGVITPLQLFRIVAWKSAKGLAPVSLNSEKDIELWTSNALEATSSWRTTNVLTDKIDWSEWEHAAGTAIGASKQAVGAANKSGLLALDGVGYPVASAILALLLPKAFPVIDKWTILGVYGPKAKNWKRKVVYRNFTERLVEVAHHFPDCTSIHEVDKAVMNTVIDCPNEDERWACLPFDRISQPSA
jgi:hypothetical protein